MIEGANPILQGFLGTMFTWGMTALGAAIVFCVPSNISDTLERKILDCGLGFGGGVMLAASYWSLLAPGISLAEELGYEKLAFLPAAVGVFLGAVFVILSEKCLPHHHPHFNAAYRVSDLEEYESDSSNLVGDTTDGEEHIDTAGLPSETGIDSTTVNAEDKHDKIHEMELQVGTFRRTMLLVVAITLHNFPEGLAVGVSFGSIGSTEGATFTSAVALAIGIGIQNFPEGMAVSLPLRRMGVSKCKSFAIGQFSGLVEPLGGIIGAAAVVVAKPLLPYAMSFAAGAMIYVVIFAIIPETASGGNLQISAASAIMGFIVMMSLDVVLG